MRRMWRRMGRTAVAARAPASMHVRMHHLTAATTSLLPPPLRGRACPRLDRGGGPQERGASGSPPSHKGGGNMQNAGRGQTQTNEIPLTPRALAAARAEAARKTPVDRNKYQTVRTLADLNAWIARVHDVGHFAIDAKATSIDPMQAEICGIALALGPNDACYIP